MGAGASASQVREHVEGLGNAYQPYGTTLEDNGVDGALVEELAHDDRAGVNATFDDLGITNKLHRRKLLQAARAQHGVQPDRPRSGSSIGSVEGPAIAVAEDLLADAAAVVAAAAPAVAEAAPAVAAVAVDAAPAPRSRSNSHATPRTPTTATWTVNLAWEGPVDLDLAAAVCGERGTFLSLVYYANTEAMNRGVVHSGDANGGQGQSQETIVVRPAALDPRATAIVLFARVHDDGASLGQVTSAAVNLTGTDVTVQPLAHHATARAAVVCRMFRDRPRAPFCVETLDAPFDDSDLASLVPRCQNLLRDVVDVSANADCKLVLLDKGGLLPVEGTHFKLGLGWDPAEEGAPMDLDVGCVLLDKDGIYNNFVYFHQQSAPGVEHSGDNRTGFGDGDDEWLRFSLNDLDPAVETISIAISAYSGSFMAVKNAFCRLVDEDRGVEVARWELSGMFEETSLVVCKLYRDAGWWKVFVIGEPIGGRSIVDFFFTDTYGPMAELREQFKRVARIAYSDAQFFKVCAEREGYGQLSVKKD